MNKNRKAIFLAVLFFVIFFSFAIPIVIGQASRILILWPNPETAKPNLQLQTFPFITIPPFIPSSSSASSPVFSQTDTTRDGRGFLAGNYCPADSVKKPGDTCECWDMNAIACPANPNTPPITCPDGQFPFMDFESRSSQVWYCAQLLGMGESAKQTPPSGCFQACIAKPVVYLYPTKPTLISVEVVAPGEVFISDPHYPEGGWKDVLANPDGKLIYQGKNYDELFYETAIDKKIDMPDEGIVIPVEDLEKVLKTSIGKFGLQGKESDEFLEYWVPALKNLKSPYIFFSILPKDQKQALDRLIIMPEPDTRIELIAYFKPLLKPITVSPLYLPDTPPARIGFTEVEWGGTIGN